MKIFLLLSITFLMMIPVNEQKPTIFQYEVNKIDGESVYLREFKNELVLIVNTASECGYTPQYKGLQSLYEEFKDDGLVILGFPANNFGGQEPGDDHDILQFCEVNYGVTFPLFSKVSVKGDDIHPLFAELTTMENNDFTGDIRWNFEKFLLNSDGELIRRFRSNIAPESDEFRKAIQSNLN